MKLRCFPVRHGASTGIKRVDDVEDRKRMSTIACDEEIPRQMLSLSRMYLGQRVLTAGYQLTHWPQISMPLAQWVSLHNEAIIE